MVAPLAPERFRIQFTVSRVTHDRLLRAQDLLRHAIPNGDPAAIFDRALITLIAQLEKQKWAAAARPPATSRRAPKGRTISATVRRAVSRRDEGRCAFVGAQGRCAATAFLEFHHIVPYARGGEATEENIQLRCRAHNQYEAEQAFGRAALFVRETSIRYGRRQAASFRLGQQQGVAPLTLPRCLREAVGYHRPFMSPGLAAASRSPIERLRT